MVNKLAFSFEVYASDGKGERALNDYGTTYVSRVMNLPSYLPSIPQGPLHKQRCLMGEASSMAIRAIHLHQLLKQLVQR